MGRYQKLDRDELLDAAENLILKEGPHSLSIGSVAKEAGVSKGGIQSNFGTKDKLVEALFERWGIKLDNRINELTAQHPAPEDQLDVFLQASLQTHFERPSQEAAMMFMLLRDPEQRQMSRDWVSEKLERLDLLGDDKDTQKRRLRFIILQSLVVTNSLGLMPFSIDEWKDIFAQADKLATE